MHAFIPLSTNTGDNLCIGHNPRSRGAFGLFEECNSGQGVQFGTKSEIRNDRIKTRKALKYIEHHLGREPWLVTRRAYYMFKRDHDGCAGAAVLRSDKWMSGTPCSGCPGWPTSSMPWSPSWGWSGSCG